MAGTTYLMGWNDVDCPGTTRIWLAPIPDPTGIYFVSGGGGTRCGVTPITGAYILAQMPAASGSGATTVDFGAVPGDGVAQTVITGQTWLLGTTRPEVWIHPEATADHTVDEHLVSGLSVVASDVVAGVGFTITAYMLDKTKTYGLWSVAWSWSNG